MPHAQTASYCAWRVCHVVGSSRSVVLPEDAPGGLLARFATRVRGGEEDGEVSLRVRLRRTDRADHLGCPAVHPGRALRCGRREHDAPQQVGPDERDLLRDEAADREAEQIDPLEVHRLEEGDRVVGHRLDGVRRPAGRGADADVVERDHASIRGERVDESGVPVVEVAAEVLQQDERHIAVTDVAVGVLDPVLGRDSLRRGVGVPGWRVSPCVFVSACHGLSFHLVPARSLLCSLTT